MHYVALLTKLINKSDNTLSLHVLSRSQGGQHLETIVTVIPQHQSAERQEWKTETPFEVILEMEVEACIEGLCPTLMEMVTYPHRHEGVYR